MRLLNLGCGRVFHSAWVNIDLASQEHVLRHDLRRPLPFQSGQFDAVYHSHVLEHFEPSFAKKFLRECFRVLVPGGLIRVVVPDLEGIATAYLQSVRAACGQDVIARSNHRWMIVEMVDQCVRGSSGGEMRRFMQQAELVNEPFVRARIGGELDACRRAVAVTSTGRFLSLLRRSGFRDWISIVRGWAALGTAWLIGGHMAFLALQEGLFRQSGEVHRWMYDRISLAEVMMEIGFVDVKVCSASDSRIPDFARYELDVAGGMVRKPDSLFMEAVAP